MQRRSCAGSLQHVRNNICQYILRFRYSFCIPRYILWLAIHHPEEQDSPEKIKYTSIDSNNISKESDHAKRRDGVCYIIKHMRE